MSTRFCILGSGSSGNAAYLQTAQSRILIDAGFSAKKLGEMLAAIGESLDRIDAIFLTHEHGDHTTGLTGLKKYPNLKIFTNAPTADVLARSLKRAVSWQVFETGTRFRFRDLTVDTFLVPHDAIEPVGYVFEWGEAAERPQHRLGWLTDIGHIPPQVRQRMRGLDLLVLEANYDTKLLEADTNRPWAVKQRISGRHGHLANHDARAFLASALAEETELREVFLVHLSRDCNSTEAVANEFAPLCAEYNGRCRITTMPAGEPSAVLELS